VWIELEPTGPEIEFEFAEKIFGGAVPRQYIPAVEKGIREALGEGVLAGYPLVNLRAILYDGSYHTVDSSEMAFKIAASMALKKWVLQAQPILLEPIMKVDVMIPEQFMGDIMGDLNRRRGRILGMEQMGSTQVIRAHAPMAEMFDYAIDLRSITQGRGSYRMESSHYEEVPSAIAQHVIEEAKKAKEG
jgi:elongation factor G